MINMVSDCCKTLLCGVHPMYRGNAIAMSPDFTPLMGLVDRLPRFRVQVQDWDAEELAKLPELLRTRRGRGDPDTGDPDPEAVQHFGEFLSTLRTPAPLSP